MGPGEVEWTYDEPTLTFFGRASFFMIRTVEDLVGKTVAAATRLKKPGYDDEGWLRLTFTDGTECVLVAGYGEYTGASEGEYPTHLRVTGPDDALVPVERTTNGA